MITSIVEPIFSRGILWKGHHTQQTILQHLLQSHDAIPDCYDIGHLARLGSEVIIVVSNDAITDGVNPTVEIKQVLYRISIFKAVHASHIEGNQRLASD